MHLVGLFCYPVKSCRGIALDTGMLAPTGLQHDRAFMVVRPDGDFLTQRELPALAVVDTALADGALRLDVPDRGACEIDLAVPQGQPIDVHVWEDDVVALDQGDGPADLLTRHLGRPVRLVRLDPQRPRTVPAGDDEAGGPARRPTVGFADGYPLLLTAEASLADLNRRMPAPLPMERFRPNLVVGGSEPYVEDTWRRIRVGTIEMDSVKPCARCAITTVDQQTGHRDGGEPLRTLRTFRLGRRGVEFGHNLVHRSLGEVHVGDEVKAFVVDNDSH